MHTIEATRRSGIAVAPDCTVAHAAAVMEQAGVGSLVILDGDELVGIVTDRDLVRRVLAQGRPADVRVDSVMSAPVVTVDADADMRAVFDAFRTHAVRRLAVVRDAKFVGMTSIDDLLVQRVSELNDLCRPVTAEILFGHHETPVPATIG